MDLDSMYEKIVFSKQWIGECHYKLIGLKYLLNEANSICGVDGLILVSELIERFSYITTKEYNFALSSIAEYIYENFDLQSTVLCATTSDRNKDSAQKILYDLVSAFLPLRIYKVRALNRYDYVHKEEMPVEKIILIDEFIGSGRSMAGRARAIKQNYKQKGLACPDIHVITIAGMEKSLKNINHNFSSLNVWMTLKQGIAQLANHENKNNEYLIMNRIESSLERICYGIELPFLGYDASESLYSRDNGSCPNNVFPLFWWPESDGKIARIPLFPRAF